MLPTFSLLALACTGRPPAELLATDAFVAVDPGDPLAGADCSDIAFHLEGDALEIETEGCSPVALEAELLEPIEVGDTLEIVWWHDQLFAEEPAVGTFSLHVDGALLYDKRLDIPGPPAVYTEAFDAPVAGSTLVLRVDNHGVNTWDLLRLTRL